jgi:DNA-binding MarR family transcriptional regulator
MSGDEELFAMTSMFRSFLNVIAKDWNKLGYRLNLTQFKILYLLKVKGDLKVSELAHGLSLTPPAVTGITDQLFSAGYIEKERAEKDRRVVYISLTSKGETMIEEIQTSQKEMLHHYFDVLAEGDIRHLQRIFTQLMEHVTTKERKK